jgi:hypothetical protein
LGDDSGGFSGQRLQVPAGEILFAELYEVNMGAGGFGDFFQEAATAGEFVSGKSGTVGDVVEKAAFGHRLSAIRSRTQANHPFVYNAPGHARRTAEGGCPHMLS